MEVVLDTSHSLLVVTSSSSELCASTPLGCAPPGSSNATSLGSFNASASSTYKSTGEQFNITALEKGNLSGDLVQDQLTLGTATVDMTFGLEDLSANYLLGIGYSLNNTYTSLPQALLESRQINSAAYSLWMEGQNGTVLFGGVNTAKYTGELYTMSIPAVSGIHYLPTVLVTNVSLQESSSPATLTTSGLPAYMIVNSAAPWTYLPEPLLAQIYQKVGAEWDDIVGAGLLNNCSTALASFFITFSFDSFNISLPLSELSRPLQDNLDTCILGLAPIGEGDSAILGGSFLRSVYSVFDLSNNEISFARRNPQPGPDNILEIGNGSSSAIPGAVSVSPATTVTAAVPTIFQQPSGVWPLTTSTSAQTSSASTPTGKSAASFSSSRNKNGLLVVFFNTCFWLVL